MALKIATIEDLDLVVKLAMAFAAASLYKDIIDQDRISKLLRAMILSKADSVVILNDDVGFLAGTITPFIFGVNITVATELAWWVDPEHRKKNVGKELIEAFEYWAKAMGCSFITMISLDKKIAKMYEKNGYKLHEHSYMKEVK